MNGLAFILALGLVGAVVGVVTAVVAVGLAFVVDIVAAATGRRLGPASRAELWLAAGLVPALAPVVVVVAGGGAALVALAGVGDHHCLAHLHHLHLCPEHLGAGGQTIAPWQALVGGGAWALALTRLVMQGRRWWSTRRLVHALTAHRTDAALYGADVVVVDGPPTLLHAAGDVVIASRSLLSSLSSSSLAAVLAHERAHLCRRDPRALDALGWAAAVVPPFMGAAVRRRFVAAAEDAADDAAALHAGASVVAGALVEVARLRLPSPLDGRLPAVAGGVDVERRVQRLLIDTARRPARPGIVLTACVVVAGAGLVAGDGVHHAAETLLAALSPDVTTTP